MSATILADPRWQESDGDGTPIAGAKLFTYAAGTSTPLATYSDSDLTIAHTNPVEADGDGRFPAIYLAATGYKLIMTDADGPDDPSPPPTDYVWTQDNIASPGDLFAENFGTAMLTGAALSQTGGFTVTDDNLFVTVASSGATVINLPAVASRTQPVCIKNMAAGTVVVTPNGSDTIEGSLSTYTIEAAASPLFPSIWLYPGTSTWWIFASHRAA